MSNPRHVAVRTASERQPRAFPRPSDADGHPLPVREFFGSHSFDIREMQEHLPAEVVRRFRASVEHGETLDPELADRIAQAVLEWALERGVSHFCHWFHPMTGSTAEKHDAFLSFDDARPISKFTGEQLIQSEPDASSFPSGGIRTTFEARGYTAWDPSSPMFIMQRTNGAVLCIPSAFIGYHGEALDRKTPLLRSMDAVSTQAVRLLHLLGDESVRRVVPSAGPEQEYFLVDKSFVALRPDLQMGGRTIIGAAPPKGQDLDDHYFGSIPSRVLAFMHELETELYKLGVPAQTRHNEVAPSQFELAVLYAEANIAADHNQLVMELLEKVAGRHDFTVLLHEKPFKGVNGSGKHLNWSLQDDLGRNLLDPGDDPAREPRFLAFLAATILGVHRNAGLLRAAIASHGNDFRLGANEAPPAIISVFLGDLLTKVVDAVCEGRVHECGSSTDDTIELGIDRMPPILRDNTDRNRTSPFAFTGNKFEFRAVGSDASVSFPTAVVNTAVAAGLAEVCDRIEAEGVLPGIKWAFEESRPVCFEGNNYADEWVAEAERRGLPNLRKTPEALEVLRDERTKRLFSDHKVLTPAELDSRYQVQVSQYLDVVDIEVKVLRQLVDQHVLPAALAERGALARDLADVKALTVLADDDMEQLEALTSLIAALRRGRSALDAKVSEGSALDDAARAAHYAEHVLPAIEAVREACDALEERIADHRWPLPRYSEMLFPV